MFRSFYMAGFECSTGYNSSRNWFDQIVCTEHDLRIEEDYARLRQHGLLTVREGIRWPLVDRGLRYDLSSVEPVLRAAQQNNIEIIYDLFHYGYPADLDPFSDEFVERFADYCFEVARFLVRRSDGPLFFTPVNEPSYLAYAAGEVGVFAPYAHHRGVELKYQLARAAIAGINAIWQVCPTARMVNADPLCNIVPPSEGEDCEAEIEAFNHVAVFESWDMLAGRLHPELGGSRRHLDIVGINYYWTNQWEYRQDGLPLAEDDPRCLPLTDLVDRVYRRYGGHICVTETAHVGEQRGPWMRKLHEEVERMLDAGIPLCGVCLYPILGMPEWHQRDRWTQMGLWDVHYQDGQLIRELHADMAEALRSAQARMRELQIHSSAHAYVS